MGAGHLYMLGALVSFSLIGIAAKVADNRRCRPAAMYSLVYLWAALLVGLFCLVFRGAILPVPAPVWRIALPFGMCAALAGIALQNGIRYGKISTSWLVINLSAAIPTAGSVLLYGEPVSSRKAAVLFLVVLSMLLLWKDKKDDERRRAEGTTR